MYTQRIILAALLAAGAAITSAKNLSNRQAGLGSLQCNIARLRIVNALGDTEDSVAEIQDPTVQEAAQAGLTQAQGGISQIAQAIFAGDAPPQDARDEVEAGLAAAGDALATGDAADTAVADASASLEDAVAAGQDVVAQC